ncbi:MAG: protoheme IX farnesyltransferase [Acidobacteria bacterium]|nr:protoheme IX farnesyltransferase [Acidobacteriota bacterium]
MNPTASDDALPVASVTIIPARWQSFLALTKPRITVMISLSAAAGFAIGSRAQHNWTGFWHTVIGIALLTSGTSTLNQYWERELDARMPRTRTRPLPAGEITPVAALWFGIMLSLVGLAYLFVFTNALAAACGFAALASYLFLYTPLKTRSTWCTFVGAFPGALPPFLGWVAARNEIGLEPLVLFAILFLWQFPHFHAIAALYRDDYASAGIKMLPVVEADGKSTAREIMGYSIALLPVSLLPTYLGIAGPVYFVGALLLGIYLLRISWMTAQALTRENSLQLLKASVYYLPLLWALMVWQR